MHAHARSGLIAGLVTLLLAVVAIPAAAVTQPVVGPTTTAVSQDGADIGRAGQRVGLPDGRTVVLPKDFAAMSMRELAAIGIVPGMGTGVYAVARSGARHDFADECDIWEQVCTEVTGQSTRVYSWLTQYEPWSATCSIAAFWVNGSIVGTTRQVCGDEMTAWMVPMPRSYADGTRLCNSWVGYAARPCITIER